MRVLVPKPDWIMRAVVACAFAALALSISARASTAYGTHAIVRLVTDRTLSLRKGVLRDHGKPFTGHLIELYASSRTKRDANYAEGRLNGQTIGMFENGRREYERTYVRGREDGEHRGWYENGARRFVFHFRNGLSEGAQREWFVSGAKYTLFHYAAGHEQGAQQLFNEDGTLRANYVIRDGRRYGLPGATGCQGATDSSTTVTR